MELRTYLLAGMGVVALLGIGMAISPTVIPRAAAIVPNAASVAVYPVPVTTFHRASSTIASGSIAQNIGFTQTASLVRCVQNPTGQTEELYLDFSGSASLTPGVSFDLAPGAAAFCMGGSGVFLGTWSVVAATTGHPFVAFEGQ